MKFVSDLFASLLSRRPPSPSLWDAGSVVADAHLGAADFRVLICCERLAASQEVHLLRPLRRLRSLGRCGLVVVSEESILAGGGLEWLGKAWGDQAPHAVVLSRFAGPQTPEIIALARRHGTPVLAHLDDFLFEVPADLGADKIRHHNRPERVEALRCAFTEADLLYVSTHPLGARLRREGFTRPMRVSELQSCADPEELNPLSPLDRGAPVRIGYQGTRNHRVDLEIILPAVIRVLEARPNTVFELFGTIETPPQLEGLGERFRRHPPVADYDAFLNRLKELRWDLGVAPLRDTEFNSFRTYTKWTEYTIAGVATVASDSIVYQDVLAGGAGFSAAPEAWGSVLLQAVDDAAERRAAVMRAQQRVREKLNLQNMERQLIDTLAAAGARGRGALN